MDLATFPTKDSIEGRNNLNVEAAQSTEVSQEDGSFAVDVEPEQDSDQVFLVSDPELGVGSWQSLGFNGTLEN